MRSRRTTENRQPSDLLAVIVAACGSSLAPLNSTMIVVALPGILRDFGQSLAWGAWIVTSYLVAMAAVQPLGGSLGDRYGRRHMFVAGLVLFLVATTAAAFAWRIEVLIIARTVQALSGAIAIPNGTAMVRSIVPRASQGRAFGQIGSVIAASAAIGPPLGGLVAETLGWRWIFLANVLLVVPALLLSARLPSDSVSRDATRFDLRGSALVFVALVALALALTAWRLEGVPIAVSVILGAVALLTWERLRRHVRRHPRPALNLGLFQQPGFMPASLAVMLSNMAMYTTMLALPVFLVERDHWRSGHVGLLLAGLSAQMVVFSPLGGRLADRLGRRMPALVGMMIVIVGVVPFVAIDPSWGWLLYLAPLIVLGIGLGLSMSAIQTTALDAAPPSQTGQAAGLFSTMRYLGSIVGAAGMAAVLGSDPSVGSFRLLFSALVLVACGAALAAWRLPGRPVAHAPVPVQGGVRS